MPIYKRMFLLYNVYFENDIAKVLKGYTFRMYPNNEQKILIEKSFGCSRYIYNYFLDKLNEKKYIKTFDYIKDLSLLSKEK